MKLAETNLDMWMRSTLLLVVLVSVLAATRADDNSTTTTTTSVTFPLPSYCPKTCGNLTFQYPFGVGHGCFRPGFELTCMNTTTADPPKLFLGNASSGIEVFRHIYVGSYSVRNRVYVKAPLISIMDANDNFSYSSWTLPAPYTVEQMSNGILVVGCSVVASLLDPTSNQTLGTCNTTCPGVQMGNYDVDSASCEGVGCCQIEPNTTEQQSAVIGLSRTNYSTKAGASGVKVYWGRSVLVLNWRINDQPSCEEAEKTMNSYACLSATSFCSDDDSRSFPGYSCTCLGYVGGSNPYVPYGCDDPAATVVPSTNCTTTCGDIVVHFPFGLQKGCFRDETYSLTCDQTANPPILSFNNGVIGQVNNIIVDQGEIEVTSSFENLADFFHSPTGDESSTLLHGLVTYKWAIFESMPCAVAKVYSSKFACQSDNSKCVDTNITTFTQLNRYHVFAAFTDKGYICKCLDGFEGNPYIPDGCKDINECEKPHQYVCHGDCMNTPGSYICKCPPKTHGDPTKSPCISHNKLTGLLLGVIIGVSIGFGTLFLSIIATFAKWKWSKITQKRIREINFRENHGILLQQLIASSEDTTEKIKIFPLEELSKATNNFDTSRILGQGGHGIVYKGILSDQRIIAIKQSKIKEKSEINEFLNEVTILSQINHRNIVKLFGCCLETEVPLLVYEFISNGTLFYHLHNPNRKSTLSWSDRLRIAIEVAGAIEYLHSYASISIFHRDMKSSNILLDDYYTVKVSDFGSSRLIPLDQSHVFTAIQGTLGYLDPEYHQTSQLTKKSDVYSFGVILLELLTGKKPIYFHENEEEMSLVTQFLQALRDNRQFELMEARVIEEGTTNELDKVVKLIEMCLKLKGSERPIMKEVEVELRNLQKTKLQRSDEEAMPLLRNISCFASSLSLVEQLPNQCTRTYSQEKEFISSMMCPR